VRSIVRVPAGYGKVTVLEELEAQLEISPDHTIYVGDGSSDVHVMLHVNNRDGFTLAVSENRHIARIAKRTVLSDSALSIVVPVFEQIVGLRPTQIRAIFDDVGLSLHGWDRARTDWVAIRDKPPLGRSAVA
jgi:predicted HAD superfamily phosphohydrolase